VTHKTISVNPANPTWAWKHRAENPIHSAPRNYSSSRLDNGHFAP